MTGMSFAPSCFLSFPVNKCIMFFILYRKRCFSSRTCMVTSHWDTTMQYVLWTRREKDSFFLRALHASAQFGMEGITRTNPFAGRFKDEERKSFVRPNFKRRILSGKLSGWRSANKPRKWMQALKCCLDAYKICKEKQREESQNIFILVKSWRVPCAGGLRSFKI